MSYSYKKVNLLYIGKRYSDTRYVAHTRPTPAHVAISLTQQGAFSLSKNFNFVPSPLFALAVCVTEKTEPPPKSSTTTLSISQTFQSLFRILSLASSLQVVAVSASMFISLYFLSCD